MAALLGLVFVVLAFVRSLRARSPLAAAAMALVGCGHVLSLWSSIEGWTASGNPIAVLGALVLGRTGLVHEASGVPAFVALFARYPLIANVAFVLLSALPFATLERRLDRLHPDSDRARRLVALTQALLGAALVDGLLLATALLARALVGA
jgi:hypothetical protein